MNIWRLAGREEERQKKKRQSKSLEERRRAADYQHQWETGIGPWYGEKYTIKCKKKCVGEWATKPSTGSKRDKGKQAVGEREGKKQGD